MRRVATVLLAVVGIGSLVLAAYAWSRWGTIADAGKPPEAWERDRLCHTLWVLVGADEAVRHFQETKGHLPQSLLEVDVKPMPPKDAWGNEIVYESQPGGGYRLVSPGPDRILGTSDDEPNAADESVTNRHKRLCSPESRWSG